MPRNPWYRNAPTKTILFQGNTLPRTREIDFFGPGVDIVYNPVTDRLEIQITGGGTSVSFSPPVSLGLTNDEGASTSVSRADHTHAHDNQPGGSLHALATTSVAGFVSPSDQVKLNSIIPGEIVLRDGSVAFTANVDGGSNRFVNISDPVDQQDAATRSFVENLVTSNAVQFGLPVSIGTSSQPGTSGQASRADHVHAHDNQPGGALHALATETTPGFLNNTDQAKLNALDPAEIILRDGSVAFNQNVDVGSNRITNVSSPVNPTDVVTLSFLNNSFANEIVFDNPVSIGTLNLDGTSSFLARADHVHAHDDQPGGTLHALATTVTPGFLGESDKTKLDALDTNEIIVRDGSIAFTGNVEFGGNRLINAMDPVMPQDVATRAWVEANAGADNVLILDTVQDIRDMAAAPSVPNSILFTSRVLGGGLDLQPEGNGPFFWDASSTSTDNTAIFVEVNGVPVGRWRRSGAYSEIKASWFGIRGGLANAASDTLSMRSWWEYITGRGSSGRGNLISIMPNGEVFYDHPEALFSSHSVPLASGIIIRGTNSRSGVNGTKLTATGSTVDLAYGNGPSNPKSVSLRFENIFFDGNDEPGTLQRTLFNFYSQGTEQFNTFVGCRFEKAWRAINLDGTVTNAENHIIDSVFSRIGGSSTFTGACLRVNNPQAVNTLVDNCDNVLFYGDAIQIGPDGGGGNLIWSGGSFVAGDIPGQLPHYVFRAEGVSGSGIGLLNNKFYVRGKFEKRENARAFFVDSAVNLEMDLTVQGGDGSGANSTRTMGELSGDGIVTLRGGWEEGSGVNNYIVDGSVIPGGNQAVAAGPRLMFENATLPQDIHDHISVLGNAQYSIGEHCFTRTGNEPRTVANQLSLPRITTVALGYQSPGRGTGAVSNTRRYGVSFVGANNGSAPSPNAGGSSGQPVYVVLPPNVLIHRLLFTKEASGGSLAFYQLGAHLGVNSPGLVFANSSVEREQDQVQIDYYSTIGQITGSTLDSRTLVISTINGNDGAGQLDAISDAYLEYSCP